MIRSERTNSGKVIIKSHPHLPALQLVFVFLSMVVMMTPFDSRAAEYRSGKKVVVDGSYTDVVFGYGSDIEAEFQSTDDVFFAGGKISYSSQTTENAFLAGGDVDLSSGKARAAIIVGGDVKLVDTMIQDLILAAGDVRLEGVQIADDVILVGGEVKMDRKTRVGGSVTLAGGEISLAGQYASDVMVAGNEIILSGVFEKDVTVHAKELELAPGSLIRGKLTHTTEQLVIAPGATVEGETIAHPYEKDEFNSSAWMKFGWFVFLMFMIATLFVSPILSMLFPALATRGCNEVRNQFWATFGKGVVVSVVLPLLLVFAFITIIGIPFAMVMVPFYFVGVALARMIGAFTLGRQFRIWMTRSNEAAERPIGAWARFGWTLLAEVALVILFFVPVVGFLLWVFVLALGFGALYATARESLRKAY